jgi:propanol-preferring alcohol dehydrogenase
MTVAADFAHRIPEGIADELAAPLLCGGAIGHRSLMLAALKKDQVLGLTGFGASGHQVLQLALALYPGCRVFVFARNPDERALALELGATWAGTTGERPPVPCDAVIDTTPAWSPVVHALRVLAPGGRLVINAIRKEDGDQRALLDLRYERDLWMEKEVKSVANLTRSDVRAFLDLAMRHQLRPAVTTYPFGSANEALMDMKNGRGRGARVLVL